MVNHQIPGSRNYNEDVLLSVIPTTYSEMVPAVVGSKVLDKVLSLMTMGELAKATMTLQQTHFRAVMSGLLQLSHGSSEKDRMGKGAKCSSQEGDLVEVWMCSLDDVKGPVHTTQKVTILPFSKVNVHTSTSVKGHCMQVHVLTELMPGPQLPAAVVPTVTYGELHPGSLRVPICLHNLSAHGMEIPAKAMVGQVVPPNQVPPVVHPTRNTKETSNKATKGWVLEALDLQGLVECPESEQKEARELLLQWEHWSVHSNLDLGKTALIKHKIQLMDQMPFKEHYQHIPPHMYDDVRAHIQEMLDIGAICKSHSPWASAVVLVRKNDGSLRFCVDLRKLNNWTVKDAYLLPQIDESLDSLQDPHWFSSLDLKSGYWQVEMDEQSKQLTAFTGGPLGFYECEWMPFRLTNARATFQRLMETCLGDLNLHWCIIYLDDRVIFSKDLASHLLRLWGCAPKIVEGRTKVQAFKMWAILAAASLSRAHDFCPRSSHQWRQNLGYQELAHTQEHHRGLKFLGIHEILLLIHPYICTGGMTSA